MEKLIGYALFAGSLVFFTADAGRFWISVGAVVFSAASVAVLEGLA